MKLNLQRGVCQLGHVRVLYVIRHGLLLAELRPTITIILSSCCRSGRMLAI
ncbi:hypothetical protein B932_3003 [Gluconobacter oxydans H24]|nr:hypothetical protein B932_3003 [Gluconobacter oxydans H24]